MELEREAIGQLTTRFMTAVREHYLRHEPDRQRVFEVLNALASTTAAVLNGADDDAKQWFFKAVDEEQADLKSKLKGS
jgi:hypothetical protein